LNRDGQLIAAIVFGDLNEFSEEISLQFAGENYYVYTAGLHVRE